MCSPCSRHTFPIVSDCPTCSTPPPRKRPLSTTTAAAVVATKLFKYNRQDFSSRTIYDYDHGRNRTPRVIQRGDRYSSKSSSKTHRASSGLRSSQSISRGGSRVPRPVAQQELISFISAQQSKHNDPQQTICKLIDESKWKVAVQVYRFTHPEIIKHIVNTSNRGVKVAVKYKEGVELEEACEGSQVHLLKQPQRSLFHKKSMVVDYEQVLASTGNFTTNSIERDINLTMIFRDSGLSSKIQASAPFTGIIGNQLVSYLPIYRRNKNEHDIAIKLVQDFITQAKKTITVAMYILSHHDILQSLHAASARGVQVQIAIDTRGSQQTQKVLEQLKLSLPIRVRKPGCAPVHIKMCLIDGKVLITGSANWSLVGLARNVEDLFIIRGVTEDQGQSLSEIWQYVENNTQPLKRSRENDEEDPLEGTSTTHEVLSPPTKKARAQ